MPESTRRSVALRSIVGLAALVIVLWGLREARAIVVLVLLATVIAVICMPMVRWLQNRRLPAAVAITLVLLAVTSIGLSVPVVVGVSLRDLLADFRQYQNAFEAGKADLVVQLEEMGITGVERTLDEWLDPAVGRRMIDTAAQEMAWWFVKAFIVLILVAFMLAEASHFHTKVHAAFPESTEVGRRIADVVENIWRYLAIKTLVSLATGASVAIMLLLIGVNYALLWGFVAFCLNYIPNVGSVIAAVPAALLALLDIGPLTAIGVVVGYLVINNLFGSIIEPRLQGHGLGLSPLVVLISLLFWGFVLGIVGALLSAPLTMAVRIACEAFHETEWIAILLGPKVQREEAEENE